MSAKESTTHYQLYRSSTLGVALQSTLGEFIEDGKIDARLAEKVMLTFDKCINNALATRLVRTRRTDFRVRPQMQPEKGPARYAEVFSTRSLVLFHVRQLGFKAPNTFCLAPLVITSELTKIG